MHPRHDKLERESTSTAVVESTLANVISSCLEGSATRKLGKVRPAACISGPPVLARVGVRNIAIRREETREREREKERRRGTGGEEGRKGNIDVRGCIVALMAASIKHPHACTLDHGRLQCHYLC